MFCPLDYPLLSTLWTTGSKTESEQCIAWTVGIQMWDMSRNACNDESGRFDVLKVAEHSFDRFLMYAIH